MTDSSFQVYEPEKAISEKPFWETLIDRMLTGNLLWLLVLFAGVLLPVGAYGLLPLMKVNVFSGLLPLNRLLLIPVGLVGLVAGSQFLDHVRLKPPFAFVFFLVIFWHIASYFGDILLTEVGINLHLRPVIMMACVVPAIIGWRKWGGSIFKQVPFIRYYLLFFSVVLFFRLFFNANAIDVKATITGGDMAGNMANDQVLFYFMDLIGMYVCYSAFSGNWDQGGHKLLDIFDRFNQCLMVVTSILSIIFIICYPLGMFTINLEGFIRTFGLLMQPNPYAHHMGLLMLYFLGLFCYYQGENKHRMPGWLVYAALAINLLGFLVGFSKTAIAALAIGVIIIFLGSVSVPTIRIKFIWGLIAMTFLMIIGLGLFSALSHQSILEIFSARMENNNSMDWRTNVWNYLLSDLSFDKLLTGHGHTASNATILQNSFSDKDGKPVIMVHNGYIQLLYDYGVWGLLLVGAVLSIMWNAFQGTLKPINNAVKPLMYTLIAFSVYFLIVLSADEMLFMFDATHLYWYLATLLFCLKDKIGAPEA